MKTIKEGLNPLSIKKYWKNLQPPDIQYLHSTKQKFIDKTFPPTLNTLFSKDNQGQFIDKVRGPENLKKIQRDVQNINDIVWKRVTELSPKWELFQNKIEFNDVLQGSLGDCYFLSAIAALADYPYLIKEKFRTKSFNEEGYYEMIFFIDGEWQIVFLDDYFPYDKIKKKFAFAAPNENELWAILLEKAWAKLNGGYSNIISGFFKEPIIALTGFPTKYLYHENEDEFELFDKIEKGNKEGTIMSSSSKNDEKVIEKGIVDNHAYTLISAKKLEERNIYLIKLRNPWGNREWAGKWGDDSPLWTDEYKRYFNFEKKEDGIFWMDINDYFDNFEATYICYILYGAIIKNFYFEYQSYFKKPVVFNFLVKEKAKMSVSVLFKNWRFNRDINDLSHPFSMIICKYDKNRNIENLWGSWSCEDDLNIIELFEPGFYVIWLYVSYDNINDPKFKYTVQVSSLANFNIEFLGLDRDFLLIQYLLLENYKKIGENNINSSKDYFIGNNRNLYDFGLSNLLIYNKTNKEMECTLTPKNVENLQLLPPYEGLNNIKICIPPYGSAALIGVTIKNKSFKINNSHQISFLPSKNKMENKDEWKRNNGQKFSNFLKLSISNSNPENTGLKTGEYKHIGLKLAQQMPKFDSSQFDSKTILQMSLAKNDKDKITLDKLKSLYPAEMDILLKKIPTNNELEKDKMWDCIKGKDGKYIGLINKKTGNLDGKGIYIWNKGIKYIGCWKDGNMHGIGILLDKNDRVIFKGNYYYNKKYGKGVFYLSQNDYYEGEFFDDKMEGIGCYHYHNGDTWEGYFKNNTFNGVGIMTFHDGEIYLYEFEYDNYMGSVPLSPEEKEKVKNLQQEERKRLLEKEKIKYQKQKSNEINNINNNLNKFTNDLYLKKTVFDTGVIITKANQGVEESLEEKKHKIFLERVELYKKQEPFMLQKFFELKALNYEEDLNLIEKEGTKYLGGIIRNNQNVLIKQGRGVLFTINKYYVGYWENNAPNGFFYTYNKDKVITFEGFLLKDYSINPKYKAVTYFPNGEKYKGYFINNKMNGFGTYYFPKGDSFTGNFVNGKYDGTGKYFYENGFITRYVTYQNGKEISRTNKMREDFRDPNSLNFFKEIKHKYPGVIEHILEMPPLRDINCELFWTQKILDNGDIYIGQMKNNAENELYGRCCFIYNNSPVTYFIGYIRNKELTGQGKRYNNQWKKIYEGNFEHNLINGFGILSEESGKIYVGEFINNLPKGKGVIYYPNSIRLEGFFLKGFLNDKAYLINLDKGTKQEIIYKNGNIIEQGEIYDYRRSKYKNLFKQELEDFEKKCKNLGLEKYYNLIMNLKPTIDTYLLRRGIKIEVGGLYIGEMNNIRFKNGRGVFIDNYTKMFYVGYFINNEKNGKGVNYYPNGQVQYNGDFRRNKPFGQGEYRYQNGDKLEGKFNSNGEGSGIYHFQNGISWKGNFYAWTKNGKGMLYDKDGNCLGEKNYEFDKAVN